MLSLTVLMSLVLGGQISLPQTGAADEKPVYTAVVSMLGRELCDTLLVGDSSIVFTIPPEFVTSSRWNTKGDSLAPTHSPRQRSRRRDKHFYRSVILGGGKKLFADGSAPHRLELTRSRASSTGLVTAHYERAGDIRVGDTPLMSQARLNLRVRSG
jgi:hypothetical protein